MYQSFYFEIFWGKIFNFIFFKFCVPLILDRQWCNRFIERTRAEVDGSWNTTATGITTSYWKLNKAEEILAFIKEATWCLDYLERF